MALATLPPAGALETAVQRARDFAEAAHAAGTRRAYDSDLRDFVTYCRTHGLHPLPAKPQVVVLYITDLAQRAKVATIRRRLAAIAGAHREREFENPVRHEIVRRVVAGIARTNGTAQTKKAAIDLDALRRLLLCIRGDDLKARRDRALLLLGFAAALRRSELAALDVEDLSWTRSGLRVTIRKSKTDQTGEGAEIPIPFIADRALCAARAVRAWLDASGTQSGALLQSFTLARTATGRRIDPQDVRNLVRQLAKKAGLVGDFSAHSLRAGFVTAAAQQHVGLDRIATVTRHKSLTVLAGYVRRANLFDDPVLASIVAPRAQNGPAA